MMGEPPRVGDGLPWIDDHRLQFGDTIVDVGYDQGYIASRSRDGYFYMMKSPQMLRDMAPVLAAARGGNVVELGVYQGGSTVMLSAAFEPRRLLAVDLAGSPPPALERFASGRPIDLAFGIDQADTDALAAAASASFGSAPLDLVVDDASHLLAPTRAAFACLFPRLRPGGAYIIEDWSWAHADDPLWQKDGGYWKDQPALTNLLVELMMACGTRPQLVARLAVFGGIAIIERGPMELDPARPLDLAQHYLLRGRPFEAAL